MKADQPYSRRKFLGSTALITGGLLINQFPVLAAALSSVTSRYKVAVVDLMILKRQKLGAFQLTKDIGADGLEVDMGSLGTRDTFESQLSDPAMRQQFLDEAKTLNLEICALGMTGFYAQSFAERIGVERMVQDCLDTAKAMNVKIAFLPLGVCDPAKKPELRQVIIDRLKAVAPKAAEAGVIIGIETSLSASEEVTLLDEIGSDYVKAYFNFADAIENNRDIIEELKTLGKNRICQIRCSNTDGVWIQNDPKIDLKKIKRALDKMKWSGWLVVERSRDAKDVHNVKSNYSANTAYVKSVFQS